MPTHSLIRYNRNTLPYGGIITNILSHCGIVTNILSYCGIITIFFGLSFIIYSISNLFDKFTENFDKYFLNNYFLKKKISNKIDKINNDLKLLNNPNLLGILKYDIIRDNNFAILCLRKIIKRILLKIHPDRIRSNNLLEIYNNYTPIFLEDSWELCDMLVKLNGI